MTIGLFGGSFNPIHIGHAILANYIIQNANIDKLWLMVSRQNPLKEDYDHSYDIHRLNMARLVSSKLANVETSDAEFSMPYPSYTIDTLSRLSQKYPDDKFKLVIGADNWAIFDKWKDYGRIIQEYGLIIYPRRGFDVSVPKEYADSVHLIDAPMIEVSSTAIRESISAGRDVRFLLPDDVYEYIAQHKLYNH